jgi:hypothetical protein
MGISVAIDSDLLSIIDNFHEVQLLWMLQSSSFHLHYSKNVILKSKILWITQCNFMGKYNRVICVILKRKVCLFELK